MNDTLDQMDFIDIYITFHHKTAEYSFFLNAHRTFSRIDHILSHKSGLNRYKKTEIIPCIFLDHNALKLELNHKKKKLEGIQILGSQRPSCYIMSGSTKKLKKNLNNSWKPMRTKTHRSKTGGILQRWS